MGHFQTPKDQGYLKLTPKFEKFDIVELKKCPFLNPKNPLWNGWKINAFQQSCSHNLIFKKEFWFQEDWLILASKIDIEICLIFYGTATSCLARYSWEKTSFELWMVLLLWLFPHFTLSRHCLIHRCIDAALCLFCDGPHSIRWNFN